MVADKLLAHISSGALKPGDKLPTETRLAKDFNVSRNVVREAIARLRSDGVIETKQGRGGIVNPLSDRTSFRIDIAGLHSREEIANLFELRRFLEVEAAGVAARRRDDADVTAMAQSIERLREAGDFDDARLESDSQFHRDIGQSTGNEYLARIIDYISSRLHETVCATGAVYAKDDLLNRTIQEHEAIFDAIKERDFEGAREAMRKHIEGAALRLGLSDPTHK